MIALTDIQKTIDGKTAVDIPTLEINPGEVAALVGTADSGRDVLFELLIGRTRPSSGRVRLAGLDPHREREAFSRQVGVLFTQDNLYRRMTALRNLQFYTRLRRLPKQRAAEVLEIIGLADMGRSIAENLTPSQSRRLALGRALLNHPKVLLLCEPFTGCEQASINLITQVISKTAEIGTSILIFAQDDAFLETCCDIVYRMQQGQIVESFDPRIERQHQRPFMVPVRAEGRVSLVDPADILYVFAQDDKTTLQTNTDRLLTQFTLIELERRLVPSGFFRAHRAYLVNLQQVKEVIPYTRDSFSLRLKDDANTEIPLSKTAERALRSLLDY
jgi:ABC-2 type transport system ATP-binding protein